jgi:ParB/RepB/Spo0J family partition protein
MSLTLIETGSQVPIDKIGESGQKVRSTTADAGIDDLLASLKAQGQIHAISLLDEGTGVYELINGHRRLTAAKRGKMPALRANIYGIPKGEEAKRELLIQQHLYAANLAEPLLPLERARQFEQVMHEFGFDVEKIAEVFDGETAESVTRTMKYLAIDQKVIDLVEASPEKFSTGHLEVLADYASPSTKGAWRMTPKEQLAAAEVLVHQTDKAVVADPRKLEGHIRQLVKKRRDEAAAEKKAARARPQADPVKALFRAIEGLEASVKTLTGLDLTLVADIEPGDKGNLVKRCYDAVEAIGVFADDSVAKLSVRRGVS